MIIKLLMVFYLVAHCKLSNHQIRSLIMCLLWSYRLSLQGMHDIVILADTCTSGDCLSSTQLDKLSSMKRHKLSSPLLCSLLTGIQKIV